MLQFSHFLLVHLGSQMFDFTCPKDIMISPLQADLYLLPQEAFPTGGLYFKNKTWVKETKGKHVIIHNNYIVGFEKKIKRFRDYGFWLVDDHKQESPLGGL